MREAFVLYFRDTDERLTYERDGNDRMSGIPKKAWLACILDHRTARGIGT